MIRETASDGQVGCRLFYPCVGFEMQNQPSIGQQISRLVDKISKEFGSVEAWPRLCQAEVLLSAISKLSGQGRVEGYWIEDIQRICFQWSSEGNSGVKAGESKCKEDSRGLNETNNMEYLCGKQRLYFQNFQHWTARGLEDDVWSLCVSGTDP